MLKKVGRVSIEVARRLPLHSRRSTSWWQLKKTPLVGWWGSEVRVSCSFQIISGRGGKCNLRGGISPSRNAVVMVHPGPDPDKTWPPPSYCHYNDTPPAPAFLHAASNHVLFWGGWPTFGGSTVWLQNSPCTHDRRERWKRQFLRYKTLSECEEAASWNLWRRELSAKVSRKGQVPLHGLLQGES